MAVKFQLRYDTTSNWSTNNPVLLAGEIGIESDSLKRIKVGDGVLTWNSLTTPFAGTTSPDISTSITTASTTFALINANATTLNFAGAASTIYMGATGGSGLTIANSSITATNATTLALNGASPAITTTSTTASIFNSTTTTLNIGAAAITLALGANTGTATINNPTVTLANATALNINGASPTIATSSTGPASIFHTNATTVNIGGGATSAVNIGNATGVVNTAGTLKPVTGTASIVPVQFTAQTGQASVTAGALEYDGTVAFFTPSTNFGRAPIATPIFTSGAGISGTSATTGQNLFPAANDTITLPIGTYFIQSSILVQTSGSTATTGLLLNIQGGGTAAGTVILTARGQATTTAVTTLSGTATEYYYGSASIATSNLIAPSVATTARTYLANFSGFMRITTAGTIVPKYVWAATLSSGTVTFGTDNHLIITPISSSGTAASTGAWA